MTIVTRFDIDDMGILAIFTLPPFRVPGGKTSGQRFRSRLPVDRPPTQHIYCPVMGQIMLPVYPAFAADSIVIRQQPYSYHSIATRR
ncbi:MAG: hypothetical protein P0Y59_00130 [Candidatus Sphingomonas phytovorans]|nr:hypothetical protein [Sphingomonas sp.]WEK00146.1 MAG: hypothetical protein P0Y59_00130 [Sphingomonas sp.]